VKFWYDKYIDIIINLSSKRGPMKLFRFLSVVMLCASIQAKPLKDWLGEAQKRVATKVLPNGLTVVCYPMPGQTAVRVGVVYNVGSKDELPHEHGYAHMVEHMIFKGTDKMSEPDLDAIAQKFCVGSLGEGYNAHTGQDSTRYYFNTDKYHYKVFLDVLADCMFNMRCDENHFASEVKAVIGEINEGLDEEVHLIYERLNSMLYKEGHPYNHPIIGDKETLLKAQAADIKAFYKRNYHPGKALLTIIGDVDVETVFEHVGKAFSQDMQTVRNEQPTIHGGYEKREDTLAWPLAYELSVYSWKYPAEYVSEHAVSMLQYILADRLTRLLVHQAGVALSCRLTYKEANKLGGDISIQVRPTYIAESTKEIEKLMSIALHSLGQDGPTEKEVSRLKLQLEGSLYATFGSPNGLAGRLEDWFVAGKSMKTALDFEVKCEKEDIMVLVRDYLTPEQRFTLKAVPFTEQEAVAWREKRDEEDRYEGELLNKKVRSTEIEQTSLLHELSEPEEVRYTVPQPDRILTLPNGLTVCLKQRESQPRISGVLCFKHEERFALAMEQTGQGLIRELVMSMMCDGTVGQDPDALSAFFEERHATCHFDDDRGSFSCDEDSFEQITQRVVSILSYPVYGQITLGVRLDELREQDDLEGSLLASQLMERSLLKEYSWMKYHPCDYPSLNSLTRDDLVKFHAQYINPSNMILVLVGDFDSAAMIKSLEKTFGLWKDAAELQLVSEQKIVVPEVPHRPLFDKQLASDRNQLEVRLGRTIDCYASHEANCLRLMQSYVSKKLYEVRESTGLFYGMHVDISNYARYHKGVGSIGLTLTPYNVDDGLKALQEVFHILQQGIPEDVLASAKGVYHLQLAKYASQNDTLAQLYGTILSDCSSVETFQQHVDTLSKVTKEQIDEVVCTFFNPDEWSVVKVGRVKEEGVFMKLWHKLKKGVGF